MTKLFRIPIPGSLSSMVLFTVFNSALLGILALNSKTQPGPAFEIAYAYGWCWLIAEWLVLDASRLQLHSQSYCGISRFIFSGFILPAHLLRTRGWKGIVPLVGISALYLAPGLVAYGVSLI